MKIHAIIVCSYIKYPQLFPFVAVDFVLGRMNTFSGIKTLSEQFFLHFEKGSTVFTVCIWTARL